MGRCRGASTSSDAGACFACFFAVTFAGLEALLPGAPACGGEDSASPTIAAAPFAPPGLALPRSFVALPRDGATRWWSPR